MKGSDGEWSSQRRALCFQDNGLTNLAWERPTAVSDLSGDQRGGTGSLKRLTVMVSWMCAFDSVLFS
jgi:hypothetical protein